MYIWSCSLAVLQSCGFELLCRCAVVPLCRCAFVPLRLFSYLCCLLDPFNKVMRKIPVQVKIGLLMTMAVILLSATGYLSYRNISSIVSYIHVDVNPEMRLLSIREISADLQKAE